MAERIPLIVSEGQKDRWDEFVDSRGDINNQSDLIRTSVERFIATERGASDLPEDVEDMIDDSLIGFERLDSRLSIENETLSGIANHQLDPDEIEDIVGLHTEMVLNGIGALREENRGHRMSDTDEPFNDWQDPMRTHLQRVKSRNSKRTLKNRRCTLKQWQQYCADKNTTALDADPDLLGDCSSTCLSE